MPYYRYYFYWKFSQILVMATLSWCVKGRKLYYSYKKVHSSKQVQLWSVRNEYIKFRSFCAMWSVVTYRSVYFCETLTLLVLPSKTCPSKGRYRQNCPFRGSRQEKVPRKGSSRLSWKWPHIVSSSPTVVLCRSEIFKDNRINIC